MSATVTNHYFLLLKLNFDACNQLGLSVCVALINGPHIKRFKKTVFITWEHIKREIWLILILNSFHMCVSISVRCVSCLSTRWKCYWDPENHLCVSSKDESKHNLLEVSNSTFSLIHQPNRRLEDLMILRSPRVRASDIIQRLLSINS